MDEMQEWDDLDETRDRVLTLGYALSGAEEQLVALMAEPKTLLLDVRLVPRSRWWPQWCKPQLRARWGQRYSHEKQLGNDNYRDRTLPVMLHGPHPERAIAGAVALLLQGHRLVLLCACKDETTCHRTFVAQMIQEALRDALHERAREDRWRDAAWDTPDSECYGFARDDDQVELG